mmetsp:Transcript_97902/g.276973  ORF Transcript_97902/g.276973 Transcript_97902/m.276973 type:complete len:312 (-) Transcript_97902:63-998(-)
MSETGATDPRSASSNGCISTHIESSSASSNSSRAAVEARRLRRVFDKYDVSRCGNIDVQQVADAFTELGKPQSEIDDLLASLKSKVSFEQFRLLMQCPEEVSSIHDYPIIGVFSSAFVDSFQVEDPMFGRVKDAFNRIDINMTGWLDKGGVAEALRHVGKSERQIQKLIDSLTEEELDFQGFADLVLPPARPWFSPSKILDVPLLGSTLAMFTDMALQPLQLCARQGWRLIYPVSETELEQAFAAVDKEKRGSINTKEAATVLRRLGYTEVELGEMLYGFTTDRVLLRELKDATLGIVPDEEEMTDAGHEA